MKTRVAVLALAIALGGAVMSPAVAEAAPATASITGKALSNSGEKLKGLTVQAKSTKGVLYTTTTDAKGRFYLTGLDAGTYGIKFSDRVGLYPCPEGPNCSDKFRPYLTTEWLGDAKSFATSEKVTVKAGEKHTGVRALVDHYGRLSGPVIVNGRPGTIDDHVVIDEYKNGKKVGGLLTEGRFFKDIESGGNYRLRVSSTRNAFAPFYIVDPRDGNTTFHSDGIEKITGIAINVTIP